MNRSFTGDQCLVVGYGAIGRRHARILSSLGMVVTVVTAQSSIPFPYFSKVSAVPGGLEKFEYVVIANETSMHLDTLKSVAAHGFSKKLLIEKPLFEKSCPLPDLAIEQVYIGYNLRFHPAICALRQRIAGQKIYSAQVYCGSYLPNWRPGRDYRDVVSSSSMEFGGVVRELSHELDYSTWLFGEFSDFSAVRGQVSDLDIPADDILLIVGSTSSCSGISIQMNFFDQIGHREIRVNTEGATLIADLTHHTFQENNKIITYNLDQDDTYLRMHKSLLVGETDQLCHLHEGVSLMKLIDRLVSTPAIPSGAD